MPCIVSMPLTDVYFLVACQQCVIVVLLELVLLVHDVLYFILLDLELVHLMGHVVLNGSTLNPILDLELVHFRPYLNFVGFASIYMC